MNNLNSVLVDGNLVADPEVRETTRGTLVCNFRLASNRYYRQDTELQEEAHYFDVETWQKSAERCRDNLAKGRNVRVVGRLKQDRWTDDEGSKHARVKIVADHVDLGPLPKKREIAETDEAGEGTQQSAEEVIARAASGETVMAAAKREKQPSAETADTADTQEVPF